MAQTYMFLSAAKTGDVDSVKKLLNKENFDVDATDVEGWSGLIIASRNGHVETVKCLIDAKSSIDLQDKDGESALMLALRYGHTETAKSLIDANASINLQDKNGKTALHHACDSYSFDVRTVVLLIEAGADHTVADKSAKKPLDYLQFGIDAEAYRPIKRAFERRKYSQLLVSGSTPFKVVKLFLLGNPTAGKTSIKESLTKNTTRGDNLEYATVLLEDESTMSDQPYIPTPGIDIGTYEVEGVGPLCIWDTAGHIEFHVTHSMFLGSENAMAVITYDLRGGTSAVDEKLKYWIKFIKSGLSLSEKAKFKIVIVGTHLDQLRDRRTAKTVWEDILEDIVEEFGDSLDIDSKPISLDAREADSKGMKILRQQIQMACVKISGKKKIPRLCEEILQKKEEWIASLRKQDTEFPTKHPPASKSLFDTNYDSDYEVDYTSATGPVISYGRYQEKVKEIDPSDSDSDSDDTDYNAGACPVIPFRRFQERVREIDPLATNELIEIAGNYLQDMGEVFLASFGNEEPRVVLSTQWLCYEIIGPTFAGAEFEGQLTKLPDKPFFKRKELERQYHRVADFSTLELLLRSLDLMVKFGEDEYIIFAKLQLNTKALTLKKMKYIHGLCILCVDNKTMFLPGLFPAIQARIMKRIVTEENRLPPITRLALKFVRKEEGLVQLTNNKEIIKFAVGTDEGSLQACQQDLEVMAAIIETALLELSPGTSIARGYLSQQDLQNADDLEKVAHYTRQEVEEAETRDGSVFHKSKHMKENVEDILIAGFDTTFIRKHGVSCDIKWMLNDQKEDFLCEMDNIANKPLLQDYRSMAEALGISKSKTQQIIRRCTDQVESVTNEIIQHWCKQPGNKMTFQLMLTLLKHSGLVGNEAAAGYVEENLKLGGHQGPYLYMDKTFNIPEDLLLARATIRRKHKSLRKNIFPDETFLGSLDPYITEDDE